MILTLFLLVLGVRVELPVEARVRGAELTLGAIAQVSGDDAAAVERVRAVREAVDTLQAEGKERLQAFMPQIIQACLETPDPDLALERVLPLVVAVLRRSAYFAMLLENPPALHELVVLCGASPWIAEQLARHPVLLD